MWERYGRLGASATLEGQIYFVLEYACSVDFVSGIDMDVPSGSFRNGPPRCFGRNDN